MTLIFATSDSSRIMFCYDTYVGGNAKLHQPKVIEISDGISMGLAGLLFDTSLRELGSRIGNFLDKESEKDLSTKINNFFKIHSASNLGFVGDLLIGRKRKGESPELIKYERTAKKVIYGTIGIESLEVEKRLSSLKAIDSKAFKYTMFKAQVEDKYTPNPCLAGIGISSLSDEGHKTIEYNPKFIRSQ